MTGRNEDADLLNMLARGITSRCEKRLRPGSAINTLCCESFHIKSRAFLKKKKGSVGQMVCGSAGKQPIPRPWRLVPRGELSKELPCWGRVGRGLFILLIDRSASSAAGTPAASSFFLFLLAFFGVFAAARYQI